MEFFDCNCFIGRPSNCMLRPVLSADALIGEMDRSGIAKAAVWHVAQRDYSELVGNDLLAQALAGRTDGKLVGCWSILPDQTGEMPVDDQFFSQMAQANVRLLRVHPNHNFLLRGEVAGRLLEQITARRIPIILSCGHVTWPNMYDLLAEFPELTAIVADLGCWGSDRWFRSLIERYPNVCIEISQYILDAGIEAFVQSYGPRRMLFGSGFPEYDHGGMMLSLRHAEIDDDAKSLIAGGNFERMIAEARI